MTSCFRTLQLCFPGLAPRQPGIWTALLDKCHAYTKHQLQCHAEAEDSEGYFKWGATMARLWQETSRSRSLLLIGLTAVLFTAALAGCNSSSTGEPPCFPPKFSANPSSARAGDQVTVSSSDARCNPRYGQNAQIKITFTDSSAGKVIDTTAPMNDAGGFIYTFNVPTETAPGQGFISAYPYDIDWCDDTGRNNRADAKAPAFTLASCAMPQESITILP
jgi:hypothetical protein